MPRLRRAIAALVPWFVVLAVPVARADRMPSPPPPPAAPGDFWNQLLHPNADQVTELLQQLAMIQRQLDDPYGATDRGRIEMVRTGYRIARFARTLDPDHADVLYYAGVFADFAGRTLEAERQLAIYVASAPSGAQRADALLHLGRIALRQGRLDDAVARLRQAATQPSDRITEVRATIALAHALEAHGDVGAAAAALQRLIEQVPLDGDPASVAAHVALAVIYDRDEQITAAFDVLTRLRTAMDTEYVRLADDALRAFPPPLAMDLHYYRALVYETWPYLTTEALASWRAYERSGAPRGARGRAADHRRALEFEQARTRPRPRTR